MLALAGVSSTYGDQDSSEWVNNTGPEANDSREMAPLSSGGATISSGGDDSGGGATPCTPARPLPGAARHSHAHSGTVCVIDRPAAHAPYRVLMNSRAPRANSMESVHRFRQMDSDMLRSGWTTSEEKDSKVMVPS